MRTVRFVAGVLLAVLCAGPWLHGGPAAAARHAALVIDTDSGAVLHAAHADSEVYPASLTKMMTLYLAFEALRSGRLTLDREMPVSRVAAGRSPSKLGLQPGDRISVRDAILALVTKSANDVATVLAEELGGTERAFAKMMTAKARALGMRNTVFRNASGLWHSQQRTTARDMARLALALIRDFPKRYDIFSTRSFTYQGRTYENHNNLLTEYDGVDGLKTGYIHASGFNLVASVERGGRRLIGVVMGGRSARSRDRLMERLFDRSFARLGITEDGRNTATAAPLPPRAQRVSTAPVPAPKPEYAGRAVAARGEWSIQVGAFSRYAPAHLAVTRAARLVPALLGSRIAILHVADDDGRLYRAQLVGLNEPTARHSCAKLQKRAFDCVVVRLDEGSAAE